MPKDLSSTNLELTPNDADALIRFVGELNGNIKLFEKTFKVKIFQNGNKIVISGDEENTKYFQQLSGGSRAVELGLISINLGLILLTSKVFPSAILSKIRLLLFSINLRFLFILSSFEISCTFFKFSVFKLNLLFLCKLSHITPLLVLHRQDLVY